MFKVQFKLAQLVGKFVICEAFGHREVLNYLHLDGILFNPLVCDCKAGQLDLSAYLGLAS